MPSGFSIHKGCGKWEVVREVGSGVNDNRKKLINLLCEENINVIVVEYKDRLIRFGFNYIEKLLALHSRRVEFVNLASDGKEDLLQDLVFL
jgi:predicted site-specific integrase-resolvase